MECMIHNDFGSADESLPAQFCMICLDTSKDCKLYPFNKYNLNLEFEKLTGISLQHHSGVRFVQQCCTECAARLSNCSKFRNKTQRAYHLLLGLLEEYNTLTIQNIRTIDRQEHRLASHIIKKVHQPNHCDLHVIGETINDTQENEYVKKETILFEELDCDIKCEVDLPSIDTFDDAIDISKDDDDDDDKPIKTIVDDIKNDKECNDFDVDVDYCDETDIEKVKKEMKNKRKIHVTKNEKKNINNVKTIKGRKKQVKKDKNTQIKERKNNFANNKNKPVKKIIHQLVSDKIRPFKKEINIKEKKINKRVRKGKFPPGAKRIPSTKLDLKLIKEIELTQEEQMEEILKRKESDNYKNSSYKCEVCFKGYYHLEAYNSHMERHTDKFGLFECDICRLRFKSKFTLKKHMYNHRVIYKCTKCQFVSNHRTAVVHHERWHDGKIYKCTHCEEKFTKCTSLMSHIRIKHPSDYVCTQCGFSFIGERGLSLHMAKKHRFADTQNLEGPLCELCNIRFASGEAYLQHVQASPKHGQLKPNCPFQKKMTKKREVPVECEQCGMKFDSANQYNKHFKAQHPDKRRTQFLKPLVSSEGNVMCEKCGKVFKAPVLLRDHMQKHTGVRLYKCDICDKSFMQKSTLTNHIHRHSDNLACDVCHKPFSNAANLQRHMISHLAVRPYYKCDFCGKSYTSIPGRDLHVAHVHLNVPWPKRVRGKRTRKIRIFDVDSDDNFIESSISGSLA